MVFSDTSTKQGIVEDIDFFCLTDSVSYPLNDKARNVNRHYYKAVIDILKSAGRVQYDDTNQTDLPISTFTLVNAQEQYSVPTNLLKLLAVEVKDSGGNWVRLKPISIGDLQATITDFEKTDGMPRFYTFTENTINLYPSPATNSVTLTAGGKLYFSREVLVFAGTDTTKEPGFAEPFHRLLSLGASYDWLVVNGPAEKATSALNEYEQLRAELRQFYSDKNRDSQK